MQCWGAPGGDATVCHLYSLLRGVCPIHIGTPHSHPPSLLQLPQAEEDCPQPWGGYLCLPLNSWLACSYSSSFPAAGLGAYPAFCLMAANALEVWNNGSNDHENDDKS